MNSLRVGVAVALFGLCVTSFSTPLDAEEVRGTMTKYVRFQVDDKVAYGIVEGDRVRELAGDLFGRWEKTDKMHQLDKLTILVHGISPRLNPLLRQIQSYIHS